MGTRDSREFKLHSEDQLMYFYIEVAHTQHRYLSSRDKENVIIHRIESGLLQQWELVDSGDDDFKYITPVENEQLVVVSPINCDTPTTLALLDGLANQDLAKWKLVPVDQEYGNGYPGANEHQGCRFIKAKLNPRCRGHRPRSNCHELAAYQEGIHNNTDVVVFGHKGVGANVAEPRNHMWILRKEPRV